MVTRLLSALLVILKSSFFKIPYFKISLLNQPRLILLLSFLSLVSLSSCVRVGAGYFSEKEGEAKEFAFFEPTATVYNDTTPEVIDSDGDLVRPGAEYSELNLPQYINVPKEPEVLRMVSHYTKRDRRFVEVGLQRFTEYDSLITSELIAKGLPLELANLAFVESCFRRKAKSHAGAAGIWQFMPATARAYGLKVSKISDERYSPDKATKAALTHLVDLYDEFSDWKLAMAAYNAGSGKIRRSIKRVGSRDFFDLARAGVLHKETSNYVPKILALMHITRNLESYGFKGDMFASLNKEGLENKEKLKPLIKVTIRDSGEPAPERSYIRASLRRGVQKGTEFSEQEFAAHQLPVPEIILD